MKPPILVVASNAWKGDEAGGAYKIASDFSVFCAQKGWEVHYICSHRDGSGLRPAHEMGVWVWRYLRPMKRPQGKSLRNFFDHLGRSGAVMRRILASVGSGRPVVLNGHSALQYLGALQACGDGVFARKVMSVHSPLAEEFLAEKNNMRLTIRDQLAVWLLRQVEKSCFLKSDEIQYDSNFTQSVFYKNFKKKSGRKGLVCPGYVDLFEFAKALIPRTEARRRLGQEAWRTEEACFFCLRRFTERMGIDCLVLACAWLKEKLSRSRSKLRFRLVLGGEGPLKHKLERQVRDLGLSDCVFFIGGIPEEELALHYRSADCFVLPSRALECFGLVILESFAAGTAVIATPVGAIPEVLGPFAEESLTGGTSPEAIGKVMLDFLNAPRENGRELRQYAENFSKDKILCKLETIVAGDIGVAS